MSDVAGEVSLFTVWLLGASMGLTACTVTCLPFIGTWALGRASPGGEAWLHTTVFLVGRLLAYTALATLAGAAGAGWVRVLGGSLGNTAIGLASVLAGMWLVVGASRPRCHAAAPASGFMPVRLYRRRADLLPPLFLGAALSLTPCVPLASLLVLAAQAGDGLRGAVYGVLFGLGATVTPILLVTPLAGRLGRLLTLRRAWMGRLLLVGAGGVLLALGVRRLLPNA